MWLRIWASTLPPFREYGVGFVFLPRDPAQRRNCERLFEVIRGRRGP
jgi:hypothetical protein